MVRKDADSLADRDIVLANQISAIKKNQVFLLKEGVTASISCFRYL